MQYEKYGKVIENKDLIELNTYKVHCICDYFIIVNDIVKLTNLIKDLKDNDIKYLILGNGSNIILPSKYNGVVIKLELNSISYNKNIVTVGASTLLTTLANDTLHHNLTGLEFASGIPGSIGAAVVGNAGAYKDEISNYVAEIEVLENNKVKVLKGSELKFEYRSSNLKYKDIIILSVTLKLKNGDIEESKLLVKDRLKRRLESQPLEYPSAGSVFRNPEGTFAGKLIEDLGLKGYTIGGAKVSEKHANFIINENNATGEDIVKLIMYIKKRVKEEYDIDLVLEQIIIK